MNTNKTVLSGSLTISLFALAAVLAPKILAGSSIPTVLTPSLPNGYIDQPYIATVRTRDADVGDTLTILSAGLPEGLSLTNCQQFVLSNSQRLHCDLTGTVTTPGEYTFKIGAMDQDGNIGHRIYTINLTPSP